MIMRCLCSLICVLLGVLAPGQPSSSDGESKSVLGDETNRAVVEAGILFVCGNRVDPPYSFEVVSGETLTVNSIVLCPAEKPAIPQKPSRSKTRDLQNAVINDILDWGYLARERGMADSTVRDSMARSIDQWPDLFDSLITIGKAGLWVYYKGDPHPEELLLPIADPQMLPTKAERLGSQLRELTMELRRDRMVVFQECGIFMSIPPERISSVLQEIKDARSLTIEEALRKQYRTITPHMAEQFARPLALPVRRGAEQ
jgi:hypothetical protein